MINGLGRSSMSLLRAPEGENNDAVPLGQAEQRPQPGDFSQGRDRGNLEEHNPIPDQSASPVLRGEQVIIWAIQKLQLRSRVKEWDSQGTL